MLTQEDVSQLYNLIKIIKEKEFSFPGISERGKLNAKSKTTKDEFVFDVVRSYNNPDKCSYQIRTIESDILFRIDIGGSSHPNPNEEDIPCPHLHVYYYNGTGTPYFENWAYPLQDKIPTNPDQLVEVFLDFLEYNNVKRVPNITTKLELI